MSGVPDILARIAESTRRRVAERRKRPLPERPKEFPDVALQMFWWYMRRGGRAPRFICEIKRASPSKGILRQDFDPAALAAEYGRAGADALSVLTEPEFFQGAPEHLTAAKHASGLPCLAKDFFLDPWQIDEAYAYGADAILLIAALLGDEELHRLHAHARDRKLGVLVEVHDEAELRRALAIPQVSFIGVNHRNLHTFEVDDTLTQRLRPLADHDYMFVSESGISSPDQAVALGRAGAGAFLIGEHFMRAERPGEELFRMKRACEVAFSGAPSVRVKICGLTNPKDAHHAAGMHASFLGIILCDGPRKVTLDQTWEIFNEIWQVRGGTGVLAIVKDPDLETARGILAAGFDGLQLHGSETPEQVAALRKAFPLATLWKALALESEADLQRALSYPDADAVLLESGTRGARISVPAASLAAVAAQRRIVIAGGLTPENVEEVVRTVRPWAVDVSSGVEAAPAKKDPDKVAAFLRNARGEASGGNWD